MTEPRDAGWDGGLVGNRGWDGTMDNNRALEQLTQITKKRLPTRIELRDPVFPTKVGPVQESL